MEDVVKRYSRLVLGLFACGLSIVFNINSNLGVAPWDVLSTGLANHTGITIGQSAILISIIVVIVDYFLGIKIGTGTLINMVLVGVFTDVIIWMNIIPKPTNAFQQWVFLIIAIIVLNLGIFLYIGAGRGAGPRDGLMIGLSQKFKKPAGIVRVIIEITVILGGVLLKGSFGVGTITIAVLGGPIMGLMFKTLKFDVKNVDHKFIDEYFVIKDKNPEVE